MTFFWFGAEHVLDRLDEEQMRRAYGMRSGLRNTHTTVECVSSRVR